MAFSMACITLHYSVLSCPVLSCLVLSCLVLSCLVLYCRDIKISLCNIFRLTCVLLPHPLHIQAGKWTPLSGTESSQIQRALSWTAGTLQRRTEQCVHLDFSCQISIRNCSCLRHFMQISLASCLALSCLIFSVILSTSLTFSLYLSSPLMTWIGRLRNSYETDVGIFEGAVPLTTTFFRYTKLHYTYTTLHYTTLHYTSSSSVPLLIAGTKSLLNIIHISLMVSYTLSCAYMHM